MEKTSVRQRAAEPASGLLYAPGRIASTCGCSRVSARRVRAAHGAAATGVTGNSGVPAKRGYIGTIVGPIMSKFQLMRFLFALIFWGALSASPLLAQESSSNVPRVAAEPGKHVVH